MTIKRCIGDVILTLTLLAGVAGSEAGVANGRGRAGITAAGGEIVTFETGKRPAIEIHVATTGDDATGDGSAGNP